MLAISLIAQGLLAVAALMVSARMTLRTGSILKGGLCLYGLMVLWVVLFGIVAPGLWAAIHHTIDVPRIFPEATGVVPVVFSGWVVAFGFAAAVRLAHAVAGQFRDGHIANRQASRLVRLIQRFGSHAIGRKDHGLYPKWVGVLLGFLLAGSAHFLSGRRRAGVVWYLSLLALGFLALGLMAFAGLEFYLAGVVVRLFGIVLWLIMLRRSYRPVRRIGWPGWLAVVLITVVLDGAIESLTRLAIHPFKVRTEAMQPTILGIHAREAADGEMPRPGLIGRLARGERYVRWVAKESGILAGPHYLPGHLVPFQEYRLGADRHRLPKSAGVQADRGRKVAKGDLIWSGCIVTGDHLIVEKVSYLFRAPRRGELVIFRTDGLVANEPSGYYVFRVAGLPGERVRIEPPWLVVDGARVSEPPIFATIAGREQGYDGFLSSGSRGTSMESPSGEIVLGDDEYFVLGDNARNAYDSRYFGPVSRKNIVGRAPRIYWPLNRIHALDGKW